MTQTVQQLLQKALSLPDEEQLELLAALQSAVMERGLRPFDDAWHGEIKWRSAEFDAGAVKPIPWAEVRDQVFREVTERPDDS